MTEDEWNRCTDPIAMLRWLQQAAKIDPRRISNRKLRLFACACGREIWHLIPYRRSSDAIEVAERYADKLASKEDLELARDAAIDAARDAASDAARDEASGGGAPFLWEVAATSAAKAAVKPKAYSAAITAARTSVSAAEHDAEYETESELSNQPLHHKIVNSGPPVVVIYDPASDRFKAEGSSDNGRIHVDIYRVRPTACEAERRAAREAMRREAAAADAIKAARDPRYAIENAIEKARVAARDTANSRQVAILRDIVGNPFNSTTVRRAWLTSDVVSIARTAYDNRIYSDGRLEIQQPPSISIGTRNDNPASTDACSEIAQNFSDSDDDEDGRLELECASLRVLSDALEEAGCDTIEILDHLRGYGPHVRGCWVIDAILGRK